MFSFTDDATDPTCIRDVCERVRIEQDEVGPLPGVDRTDVVLNAEELGRPYGGRAQRLERRQPGGNELLQFYVQAITGDRQ